MAKKPTGKQTKKVDKKETKKYNPDEIPILKSPGQTVWGKIIVIIIVSAMLLGSIIGLIIGLSNL